MFKNEFWKVFTSKSKYDTSALPEDIQKNIKIILEERKNAYAPYSGFGVAVYFAVIFPAFVQLAADRIIQNVLTLIRRLEVCLIFTMNINVVFRHLRTE